MLYLVILVYLLLISISFKTHVLICISNIYQTVLYTEQTNIYVGWFYS